MSQAPIDQTKWDRRWLDLARHYAGWSNDPSTQVGCVIARDKEQLSQGYNGFPAGIADTDARLADRDTRLALTLHAEHNALLRIETEAGHGAGKPLEKVLDETSDIYAFLFRELQI